MMPAFAQYIHIAARVKPETEAPNKGITKQPLTTAEKLAIVADWQKSGLDKVAYSRKTGVNAETLRQWSKGRALGRLGQNNSHGAELKAKVLALHREGRSKRQIEKELGVSSSTVYEWVQRWRHEGLI